MHTSSFQNGNSLNGILILNFSTYVRKTNNWRWSCTDVCKSILLHQYSSNHVHESWTNSFRRTMDSSGSCFNQRKSRRVLEKSSSVSQMRITLSLIHYWWTIIFHNFSTWKHYFLTLRQYQFSERITEKAQNNQIFMQTSDRSIETDLISCLNSTRFWQSVAEYTKKMKSISTILSDLRKTWSRSSLSFLHEKSWFDSTSKALIFHS